MLFSRTDLARLIQRSATLDSGLPQELDTSPGRRTALSRTHTILLLICVACAANAQFVQQGGLLLGAGAIGNAGQGYSVALSSDGNTALVGGPNDNNNTGAAWVYTRSGGVWNQQGSKLVGSGAVGLAWQGFSVAISGDGNTAIVGGPCDGAVCHPATLSFGAGAVWVFTRSGSVWTQQGSKLVANGAVGNAGFGSSVSLSADGNTAIVSAPADNNFIGAVWAFTRSSGVWTQQGSKLVGTGAIGSALQGYSVSLSADGNTAIVGGPVDNVGESGPNGVGAAWVFTRSAGAWTQQGGKLVGSGAVGSAAMGNSVAISGDGNTAIVGGENDNHGPDGGVGATWVFTRSGGVWTQQGSKLVSASYTSNPPNQGWSVALSSDGNTALVGGPDDNFNDQAYAGVGAVWAFTRSGGVWAQQGGTIVGAGVTAYPLQGWSVALSGDGSTAIVGGPCNNGACEIFSNGVGAAGAAWVLTAPQATQAEYLSFEGFPDGTILTTQYSGLTFSNAVVLTAGTSLNESEFPPHSGANVAADHGGPMSITFAAPVQSFSGYFTYSVPLTLQAFNSSNSPIASAVSQFSNNEALSGVSGSQPNELLQVLAPAGASIFQVVITGSPGGASFTVDDITAYTECDIAKDGGTKVIDAQRMVNEAFGVEPPTNDVNGDGVINVVDVQIVINAALGLGCSTR